MTLLQFPADRRTADVKRCAEALLHLHGEDANVFWRDEMRNIAANLASAGAAPDEVSRQAGLFMHAVQAELCNLYGEADPSTCLFTHAKPLIVRPTGGLHFSTTSSTSA